MPSDLSDNSRRARLVWAAAAVLAVGLLVVYRQPLIEAIAAFDAEAVERFVDRTGLFGPLAIILLMMAAIVASPLPSAPIAMAAGLIYGHLWGTVIVAAGAELGALVAFSLARWLGRAQVERWLGQRLEQGLLGSQNALMLTVFVSRLLPFISFDAISYAAGLSRITLWRFALATLAGIIPASYVLSHFGAEAVRGGATSAGFWITLGLGAAGVLTATLWARR